MDVSLMVEVAVGAVAAVAVMLVVVAAYREGKRVGEVAKSDSFDGVRTALALGGTEWSVTYENAGEDAGKHEITGRLRFRQLGSRVIGEGETTTGDVWSVEGSAQERRLCFLYLDRERRLTSLGSVMVEADSHQREMLGVRTSWSETFGAVSMQPIRLVRVRA